MFSYQFGRRACCATARALAGACLFILPLVSPGLDTAYAGPGGEGHSHDAVVPTAVANSAPRLALRGDLFDIVAIPIDHGLRIFVDRLEDNAPVKDASVSVKIGDARPTPARFDGDVYLLPLEGPVSSGAELTVIVSSDGEEDFVTGAFPGISSDESDESVHDDGLSSSYLKISLLGGALAIALTGSFVLGRRFGRQSAATGLMLALAILPAFAGPGGEGHSHDGAPQAATGDAPRRIPGGIVFVPKDTQRLLEVRTTQVHAGEFPRTIRLDGKIIPAPGAIASLHSVKGGRVSANDHAYPFVGMKVAKGQLLATVEPTINAADATTIAATVAEIEHRIATTSIRLQRLTTLAAKAAAPEAQVRDLEAELQALKQRLERVRGQAATIEHIVAATDGVIAAVNVSVGGIADPNQSLFQLRNPGALWVEARDFSGLAVRDIRSASLISPGQKAILLRPEAASPALVSGAGVLSFSLPDDNLHLKAGELVSVIAKTEPKALGIAVPAAAIARNVSGLPVVYEHTVPEHFTMRVLVGDYVDNGTFVAQRGLNDGARIVTTPAHLINQIR